MENDLRRWMRVIEGGEPLHKQRLSVLKNPAFVNWFGNSQAVDQRGLPLICYHGTRHDFDEFDPSRTSQSTDYGWFGTGIYLTPQPQQASLYAQMEKGNDPRAIGHVMPLFVRAEDPFITDHHSFSQSYANQIRADGYDAVFRKEYMHDPIPVEIVVFHPNQVKSAIANRGNFDRSHSIGETMMESMRLSDLDPEQAYQLFARSYEGATGAAWSKEKFLSRARDWDFFGDSNGYVAVRAQRSGMLKLVGVAGDPRSIVRGLTELQATGKPVWGAVSAPLAAMAKKRGMLVPHTYPGGAMLIRALIASVPDSVFGGVRPVANKDGGLTFDYADVGPAVKYLIGNKQYFIHALKLPEVADKLKAIPGAGLVLRMMGLAPVA
jgi:hypothetical protein